MKRQKTLSCTLTGFDAGAEQAACRLGCSLHPHYLLPETPGLPQREVNNKLPTPRHPTPGEEQHPFNIYEFPAALPPSIY